MKVGIISPIVSLRRCCTTKIQYCLPSLIAESKAYRDFYQERKKAGDYLILDTCKVGWKREPESPQIIREALRYIEPSITVTPSYMYNLRLTLKVEEEFLKQFKPQFVAGCIEGTNSKEALACARGLKKLGVRTFAIPSYTYKFQKAVKHNGPTIYLDNHLRVEELDALDGLLVTSLPVRLGLQGRLLSNYSPSPPALTFYEEDKFSEVVKRNIEEALRFYGAL